MNVPSTIESAPQETANAPRANAIEYNLLALIRAWPAFETETVRDRVGSYGYMDTRDNEAGTQPPGALAPEQHQRPSCSIQPQDVRLPQQVFRRQGDSDICVPRGADRQTAQGGHGVGRCLYCHQKDAVT